MKAIVNIGYRKVNLIYSINQKDLIPFDEYHNNKNFKEWELTFGNGKSKKIICKHSIFFSNADELQTVLLFDGRTIDFHYDYINREEMKTKKEWGSYIFQGYEYVDGEPQLYEHNIVDKIIIKF